MTSVFWSIGFESLITGSLANLTPHTGQNVGKLFLNFPIRSMKALEVFFVPHRIHVLYIYLHLLHLVDFQGKCK